MGILKAKGADELKSQLQDFLSNSPYAEQLQGLLDLSEEELQDTHAVQKFLEQEHLDPQIWNDYIDRLKVKRLLEHNQYFAKVDSFRKDDFLKIDFDLIAFFDQHGFLGRDISQT